MILITSLYPIKNKDRLQEIESVIIRNSQNEFIDKIIVFFENYEKVDKEEYNFLNNNKISIVQLQHRPTFGMFLEYANTKLIDEVVIVSNSDILFDKTINRVKELPLGCKNIHLLSRYEGDYKANREFMPCGIQVGTFQTWSFDSYIFKSPIQLDRNYSYYSILFGSNNSDPSLYRIFKSEGFKIRNPVFDIRSFHIHSVSGEGNVDVGVDYNSIYGNLNVEPLYAGTVDGLTYRYNILNPPNSCMTRMGFIRDDVIISHN